VVEEIAHPNYIGENDGFNNDIAVWVLKVKYNPSNRDIPIFAYNTEYGFPEDNMSMDIAGWGKTESEGASRQLMTAWVKKLSDEEVCRSGVWLDGRF
jgi:hypothetical protein